MQISSPLIKYVAFPLLLQPTVAVYGSTPFVSIGKQTVIVLSVNVSIVVSLINGSYGITSITKIELSQESPASQRVIQTVSRPEKPESGI